MLRICGINTVEQRLEIALHDRERGSQLVRDVREKLLSLHLAALETRGHRVERAGERTKLARPAWPYTNRVVPCLHALSSVNEVAERGHQPADPSRDCGRDDE